jgi:hypothetical protein
MHSQECSMSHIFTVEVSGINTNRDDYENVLYGVGCDDALIVVIDDKLYLDFDREAESFERAVDLASRDIERAGGKIIRVMPTAE